MQKEIGRVVGANLGLILLIGCFYGVNSAYNFEIGAGISGGIISFILVPANFFISLAQFINRKNVSGQAFLLATALCLLIGYSLCTTYTPIMLNHPPK